MYPSFEFKHLCVSLKGPDRQLESVLNSPFKPGYWVKEVIMLNLTPPKGLKKIEPTDDPLFRLIRLTPDVKEVSFLGPEANAWLYFASALFENANWKLEKLPEPVDVVADAPIYFNCANHVRNSLKEFNLTRLMIGKGDFDRLAVFKNLTELTVVEIW